ncbi:MAG: hypothetical protein ACLPQ6_01810 [Steroidobacteraceae bacterium]
MPAAGVAEFRGTVRCRRPAHAPVGLELSGRAADAPGEELTLAFTAVARTDLPEIIEDAVVEHSGEGEFRVRSGTRTWVVAARAVHAHRDVGAAFYRAIPPRRAPFMRRLLLRTALSIAGSRAGLAVVRALRR